MNGRITHAVFNGEQTCETAPLYQYDYGQVLMFDDITLPETYEVLFSNNITEPAYIVIGSSDGAAIPDKLLITGKNIVACVFLHDGDDDGETEYVARIPVRPRSVLSDDQIDEEEHSIVSDLIAIIDTLNEKIDNYHNEISLLVERISTCETQILSDEDRITFLENRIPALGGWKTQEVTSDDSNG